MAAYNGPTNVQTLDITTNKTLAATDSGTRQNVIADGLTITLPASATVGAGYCVVISVGGVPITSGPTGTGSNGQVGVVVATASGDGVTGGQWTAAINKGLTYTKATGRVGDRITLVASGANTAAAWNVQEILGTAWGRTP